MKGRTWATALHQGAISRAPADTLQDIRNAICLALEQQGVEVEVHHQRSPAAGADEIGTKVPTAGEARRLDADPEVHDLERLAFLRQDRDLHAQAHRRRQRVGHAPCTSPCEGRAEPVYRQRYAGLSDFALYYIGGIIKHAKALNALPTRVQLLQALGTRFRGADQSRLFVRGTAPLRAAYRW